MTQNKFIPPNHNFNARRTQDAAESQFKKFISSTDISTLKTTVESNFPGVSFIFSGNEFDYDVVLQGSKVPFQKAMNSLFPKGRDDIIIQPAQTLP